MKSIDPTLRSHRQAQHANEGGSHAAPVDRIPQDISIYLRRGHKARSEAFYSGFRFLGRMTLAALKRTHAAGDAIHTWLFTPFYSGGRKS